MANQKLRELPREDRLPGQRGADPEIAKMPQSCASLGERLEVTFLGSDHRFQRLMPEGK